MGGNDKMKLILLNKIWLYLSIFRALTLDENIFPCLWIEFMRL